MSIPVTAWDAKNPAVNNKLSPGKKNPTTILIQQTQLPKHQNIPVTESDVASQNAFENLLT